MYIDVKKNLWFGGSDSRKSVLDLYLPTTAKKVPLLIFCHGFKGFKDWGHFTLSFTKIAENGIAVLSFNFSHNGGTVENPIDFPDLHAFSKNTYSKEVNDIGFVLEWISSNAEDLLKNVDKENISIMGHSRGGGIVLLAASKYNVFRKVITWAAVSDFEARMPDAEKLQQWKEEGVFYVQNGRTKQNMPMNYTFVEDLIENRRSLNIEMAIKKLKIPILIVHGKEDETVNVAEAKQLANWNPKASLHIVEKADHVFNGKHPWNEENIPDETSEAIETTVNFMKR